VSDRVRLPDIAREVECFLRGYDRLVRLPLITDAEMEGLFSLGMLETLERFKQYDQDNNVCSSCAGRCCALIRCELYEPAFGVCPVFSLRPLLCRLHYCSKFDVCKQEIKIIGDIFLQSLIEIQKQGSPKTALFDSPPLAPAAPALADRINALTAAFREGRLDRTEALLAIQKEAEKYRFMGL
jgi:hypothetical protein